MTTESGKGQDGWWLQGLPFYSTPNTVWDTELSLAARATYCLLCRLAGPTGTPYPSDTYLGEHLDYPATRPRTVRKYLRELEQAGWLRREQSTIGGGLFGRRTIHLVVPGLTVGTSVPAVTVGTSVPRGTSVPTDIDVVVLDDEIDAKILRIFEHWKAETKHPRAKLTDQRKRLIHARLKTFTEPDLMLVATWAAQDDFYGSTYDWPQTIYRSDDKVEELLDKATRWKGAALSRASKHQGPDPHDGVLGAALVAEYGRVNVQAGRAEIAHRQASQGKYTVDRPAGLLRALVECYAGACGGSGGGCPDDKHGQAARDNHAARRADEQQATKVAANVRGRRPSFMDSLKEENDKRQQKDRERTERMAQAHRLTQGG